MVVILIPGIWNLPKGGKINGKSNRWSKLG